jgi:hypothetical protein
MNVAGMNATQKTARSGRSVLSVQFQVLDDRPDWPVVQVLVDGRDLFAKVASDWRGFDPAEMLGPRSPLLPVDLGRRVAVYQCSCGVAGCGVIAPVIISSPDGSRVSWVDFRDYVGVFSGPVAELIDQHEGKPWDLPDLHFDPDQYITEVERASRDGSWETPRRRTARLLHEHLVPMGVVLPPDFELAWASPAWNEDGVTLMFQHLRREPGVGIRQQLLKVTSAHSDPEHAAEDMADQLLSTSPEDWVRTFGRKSR